MTTVKVFNNHIKLSFIFLAVIESLVFYAAIFAAVAIRYQTLDLNTGEILAANSNLVAKAIVFAAANMLGMTALGLYQIEQFRGKTGYIQIVSRVLVSLIMIGLALMILYYLAPYFKLGRGVTALAFLVSLVCIVAIRRLFFLYLGADLTTTKVIVFGVGHNAASLLVTDDGQLPTSSYRVIGFISTPEQMRFVPEEKILDSGESLLKLARRHEVNEIVIALDDRSENYPVQQILDCKLEGISIIDPVSFLEREQGKVNLSHLNPSWMVFSDGFRGSKVKTAVSRGFDLVSSLAILILTAPILLLAAFLIALEGRFKEPVLYRQSRVGKNGQSFDLLKFRSMAVNAESNGAQWAGENDPRVTRVGRVIRKLRIDELPQIINIVKGDMRLVGPRPERPEFVEQLSQSIDFYQQRHSVKPGLAGWAQLKYPYGASEKDAYEKLQYDLYYIKNANPVMDFFILLQTLEVIVFGKGVR